MNVINKRVSSCEVEELYKLENTIFGNSNMGSIKDSVHSDSNLYYVVKANSKLIGFANIRVSFDEAEIINIAISKDSRGEGLSKRLLKHIVDDLPQVKTLFLEVRESNQVAINLYESFGFKKIGLREKYYSNNENAIVMRNTVL